MEPPALVTLSYPDRVNLIFDLDRLSKKPGPRGRFSLVPLSREVEDKSP